MGDFIDLITKAKDDPNSLKAILRDQEKLSQYELSSSELEALKKMDPATIKAVVEGIEDRLSLASKASNACSGGTNACRARMAAEMATTTQEAVS
ncbi:MAG: hypothetical protein FIB08_05370 [Candidatus Methanoperedens sp.]|nr:hypothetical protein [Candidatus Methanoperedens sp.]